MSYSGFTIVCLFDLVIHVVEKSKLLKTEIVEMDISAG